MPPSPALVLAGAGSGKTRVITHRIAYLLESGQASASEILAMTFTNRAAAEMRERLHALAGRRAEGALVTTFHSACARWLRTWGPARGLQRGFSIYDTDDQRATLKRLAKAMGMPFDAGAIREYLQKIDRAHNSALDAQTLETQARSTADEEFADLYRAYHEALRQASAVDFGTLITEMVHLLEENTHARDRFRAQYRHVLVDEFQDTNGAQYRLLRALAPSSGSVMIVGDDDQSIYGWRGAEVENVRRFLDDWKPVEVIKLEQNYRSIAPILQAAHQLVVPLSGRIDKKLIAERAGDERPKLRIALDDRDEAEAISAKIISLVENGVDPEGIAIFYRTNAQSRVFEQKLRAAAVPYRVVGSVGFFDRKEVKDVVAYLRLVMNPADDAAFARVANTPPRGIGATTLEQLYATRENNADWVAALGAFNRALPKRVAAKTRAGLSALHEALFTLHSEAASQSPSQVLEAILTQTQYLDWLRGSEPDSFEERARNVEELLHAAREFERDSEDHAPEAFLERISLETGRDEGDEGSAVQLMTVHTSKGLEFPVVFVTGLEEKLFPLERRDQVIDEAAMEEERRLAYVALTRAKDQLFLSAARQRQLYGQLRRSEASVFLRELIAQEQVDYAPDSTQTTLDWNERAQPRTSDDFSNEWQAPRAGSRRERPTLDDFDQRDWAETAPKRSRVEIPDEGVVFDDSYWPEKQVQRAQDTWLGRRVHHKSFGQGSVQAADATGDRVRLTIRFDSGEERKVISNYVTRLQD